jgi:hypothetical protein
MMESRLSTILDINKMINNLDEVMDGSPYSDEITKDTKDYANPNTEKIFRTYSMLLGEVWYGFLEYCKINELDPAQQLKEASATHYQELLKMHKTRMKLSFPDETTEA